MMDSHYFTCHWDESGADPGTETKSKSDTPLLLVGGYLAHVREWQTFEEKWKLILEEAGLAYFRMAEFANLRLPYRLWPEEKRETLITALLDVIAECPRVFVCWAIEIDAYMEIVKARNLLDTDIVRAYHICARKCIETVHGWVFTSGYKGKILHIFDRGNSAWPTFESTFTEEMLDDLNILQPITQSKEDVLPLQAADILAHQVCRNLLISSGRIKDGLRLYTKRLFGKPGMYRIIDMQELKRVYREEMMLERARDLGLRPKHVVRNLQNRQVAAISEFFKEPEDYSLNTLLREKQ